MEEQLTYEQLILNYGAYGLIPYAELLTCVEWKQKRNKIVQRDNEQCQTCNKRGTDTVFVPGHKSIHFYEDLFEFEYEDNYGLPRIGIKMVMKRADEPVHLHVHHKYYILSRKPWEYENDALETLCSECHTTFHQNNRVPVWLDETNRFMELHLTPCPRCNGAGHFSEYSHVQGGRCFYCKGSMYTELMK